MVGEGVGFADCVGGMGSSESGAFELQCAGYFHQLAALHLFYLIAVNRLVLKNAVVQLREADGLGIRTLVVAEAECGGVVFNCV